MSWRKLLLYLISIFLKVGFGLIPVVGPALVKYSKNLRYDLTGVIADKILDGKKCPRDGGVLIPKRGRYGRFIACSNYPQCTYTRNN